MSLLERTISLLAPPECIGCGAEGSVLCSLCVANDVLPYGERCGFCGALSPGCRSCPKCRASAPSHVFITTDYTGVAQDLLRSYKFGHLRLACQPLTDAMAETYLFFKELEPGLVIVPVPTATSRQRQRGFDHTTLLAEVLAGKLGLKSCSALGRLGQARQVGSVKAARIEQIKGSYYVKRPDKLSGQHVLLVDDVITTGATLRAVTKVVRRAGAGRVDALVFAKRL